MPTVVSAVPIIPARDVAATTAWYSTALGFTVKHVEAGYGIVQRDTVQVHFWGPSGIEPQHSMTMYRLGVRGIDELYRACETAGVVHPDAPLAGTEWGGREFGVCDRDGNLLTFFEQAE